MSKSVRSDSHESYAAEGFGFRVERVKSNLSHKVYGVQDQPQLGRGHFFGTAVEWFGGSGLSQLPTPIGCGHFLWDGLHNGHDAISF